MEFFIIKEQTENLYKMGLSYYIKVGSIESFEYLHVDGVVRDSAKYKGSLSGWFSSKENAKLAIEKYHELQAKKNESACAEIEDLSEDNIVGNQYKHLKIDTVAWSKANHTKEQQKAICQFMINKYTMRDKGQDKDDLTKVDFYNNWMKELI